MGGKTQLRQQTSLLAQLMEEPAAGGKKGAGRTLNRKKVRLLLPFFPLSFPVETDTCSPALPRKQSSNTSAHSRSTSLSISRLSPSLSLSHSHHSLHPSDQPNNPTRPPYPFDPTQQTQEDESLYVMYDNPEEAEAREQIRLALAAGKGGVAGGVGESQGQESIGTTPGRRRSTRAAAVAKR